MHTRIFRATAVLPREWARENGLKGAILNGISGQGAEVC